VSSLLRIDWAAFARAATRPKTAAGMDLRGIDAVRVIGCP
jgi:hypothetical protein